MFRRPIMLIGCLVVLLSAVPFLLSACRTRTKADPDEADSADVSAAITVPVATVRSGRLAKTLHLTGMLEPLPNRGATVSAQITGTLQRVSVKLGSVVRAGQLLALVASPDLSAEARRAQAADYEAAQEAQAAAADAAHQREYSLAEEKAAQDELDAANARLRKLEAGSRPEEVAAARAALKREQADLERMRAGARPQELAQAEAAVQDAEAQVRVAQKEAERLKALFADGLAPGKDVDRADADLAAAEAKLTAAREALSLLKAGPRPEEIQAQEARVEEAQQALKLALAGPRPEEIQEARAQVQAARAKLEQARAGRWQVRSAGLAMAAARSKMAQAQAALAVAQASADKARVVSPVDGVVSRVLANKGEVVAPGTPICEVTNADAVRVVTYAPERYRTRITPGMPARISIPWLSNRTVDAAVSTVGSQVDAQNGMVRLELILPNRSHKLLVGGAVDVELTLAGGAENLLVPTTAIFSRAGESYVYVVGSDGTAKERRIDVGNEDGGQSEVLTGLKLGEQVVADGTMSLADGTKVRAAK